jgi:hypothetical protein
MHSYAVDFIERRNIPYYLAAGALGCTFALRWLLQSFGFDAGSGVYVPSGFALYGLLYLSFDQLLWRCGVLRFIGIVLTPNLHGKWVGDLRSSHSGLAKPHPITIRIHQTWTTIRITLETDRSLSASDMACVTAISPNEFELRWEYRAEAKNPLEGPTFNHRGVTNLRFTLSSGRVLPEMKGDYYTQHSRETTGTVFVIRSAT